MSDECCRRERSGGASTLAQEPNIVTEMQCALYWAVRCILLLWLIMLTWICAALYHQVSTMRMEIAKGMLTILSLTFTEISVLDRFNSLFYLKNVVQH